MTGSDTFDAMLRNKKILFAGAAALGGLFSGIITSGILGNDSVFLSWVGAGALDAALIGAFVVYAQNYYQTKSIRITSGLKRAIKKGALIGCLGGFAALAGMYVLGAGNLGRIIGWAISGGVAGYVVACQVPNLKQAHAITAGAIGGGLGCLLMLMSLGYTTGVAITGATIGLMVAMVEVMFRKNWIDIEIYPEPLTSGLNLNKPVHQYTLTLGNDPITIGSKFGMDIKLKPNSDGTINHLATIYVEGEKAILHDMLTSVRTELSAEKPHKIGECLLRLGC